MDNGGHGSATFWLRPATWRKGAFNSLQYGTNLEEIGTIDFGVFGDARTSDSSTFSVSPRTSLLPSVTFLSLSHLFDP